VFEPITTLVPPPIAPALCAYGAPHLPSSSSSFFQPNFPLPPPPPPLMRTLLSYSRCVSLGRVFPSCRFGGQFKIARTTTPPHEHRLAHLLFPCLKNLRGALVVCPTPYCPNGAVFVPPPSNPGLFTNHKLFLCHLTTLRFVGPDLKFFFFVRPP